MNDEELEKIGEWLNSIGFDIDLNDCFWMEDYRWDEHKTRDIAYLLDDYYKYKLNIKN